MSYKILFLKICHILISHRESHRKNFMLLHKFANFKVYYLLYFSIFKNLVAGTSEALQLVNNPSFHVNLAFDTNHCEIKDFSCISYLNFNPNILEHLTYKIVALKSITSLDEGEDQDDPDVAMATTVTTKLLRQPLPKFSILHNVNILSTSSWSRSVLIIQKSGVSFTDKFTFLVVTNQSKSELEAYVKKYINSSFFYVPLFLLCSRQLFMYCFFCNLKLVPLGQNDLRAALRTHFLYNKILHRPNKLLQLMPQVIDKKCISYNLTKLHECVYVGPVIRLCLNHWNFSFQNADQSEIDVYEDTTLKKGLYIKLSATAVTLYPEDIGRLLELNAALYFNDPFYRDLYYNTYARHFFQVTWEIFLHPFDTLAWVCILVICILISILSSTGNRTTRDLFTVNWRTIGWVLISVFFSTFSSVNEFRNFRYKSLSLICAMGLISILLVNLYLGTFTSMFISQPPQRKIKTLRAALDNG